MSSAAAGSLASWNLAGYTLMAAVGGIIATRLGSAGGDHRRDGGDGGGHAPHRAVRRPVGSLAGPSVTGMGNGLVLVPSITLMAAWFDLRQLGLASSIVPTGSSLALIILGPVVPRIIAAGGDEGWRLAWYFFAAIALCLALVNAVMQRDRRPNLDLCPRGDPASGGSRRHSPPKTSRRKHRPGSEKHPAVWVRLASGPRLSGIRARLLDLLHVLPEATYIRPWLQQRSRGQPLRSPGSRGSLGRSHLGQRVRPPWTRAHYHRHHAVGGYRVVPVLVAARYRSPDRVGVVLRFHGNGHPRPDRSGVRSSFRPQARLGFFGPLLLFWWASGRLSGRSLAVS